MFKGLFTKSKNEGAITMDDTKGLEFGYNCKDIVTGFEGILKSRAKFITGCDRVGIVNKEGEEKWFDVPTVTVIDEGVFKNLQETNQCNEYSDIDEALYDFGTLAKDIITNYEGKIVCVSIGISGDISYGLSPKFEKENRNNDAVWFDEGRIEIIDTKKDEIKSTGQRTGGATPNFKCR